MSEHEYTIDGYDAARIVMTLRNLANMTVIQEEHPARLTDIQMTVVVSGHAINRDRPLRPGTPARDIAPASAPGANFL